MNRISPHRKETKPGCPVVCLIRELLLHPWRGGNPKKAPAQGLQNAPSPSPPRTNPQAAIESNN